MLKATFLMAIMAFAVLPISAAEEEDEGDVSDIFHYIFLQYFVEDLRTNFINSSSPKAL